jgi:hypothetical protein
MFPCGYLPSTLFLFKPIRLANTLSANFSFFRILFKCVLRVVTAATSETDFFGSFNTVKSQALQVSRVSYRSSWTADAAPLLTAKHSPASPGVAPLLSSFHFGSRGSPSRGKPRDCSPSRLP